MATGSYLSIVDVTNRLDPDLSVAPIAEMLSQCNEFIDDVPWQAGNEVGGHEFTLRTSIPTGYWRQLGQGTPFSKSTTVKARVSMGELVGWSQIAWSVLGAVVLNMTLAINHRPGRYMAV